MQEFPRYIELFGWVWFEESEHDQLLEKIPPPVKFEIDLASVENFWEDQHPGGEVGSLTTIETRAGGYYTLELPFVEFQKLARTYRSSFSVWLGRVN